MVADRNEQAIDTIAENLAGAARAIRTDNGTADRKGLEEH
jgi:hypothetical protein